MRRTDGQGDQMLEAATILERREDGIALVLFAISVQESFFLFIMYIVNPDVTKLFYIVVRKSTWGVAWILAAFHIVLNSS